jgi:predicted N-formylglutamate amidohydrolase
MDYCQSFVRINQSNSLVNQNNPYSFTDKSSKQIIKEALISGTINALLGINPDEAEKQRLKSEN